MKRALLLSAVVLALAFGCWSGWSWFSGRNLLLSEPPARGASDTVQAVRESVLAVAVRVPFPVLDSYLDKLSDELSKPSEASQDRSLAAPGGGTA